jgi:predicted DCC family thiol-disulfide oxidoreductase YuxK
MVGEEAKPLLIFDGRCGFCRQWVEYARQITGDRVSYAPFQEAAGSFPQIPYQRFTQAVQLILPDGRTFSAAEAVFRTLAFDPSREWMLSVYHSVPGAAAVCEFAYRTVARHRDLASRIVRLLWGRHFEPPTFHLTRWLFLRAMGLVYLAAFLSLWPQIAGLAGSRGVLPLSPWLDRLRVSLGVERYWLVPTLAWLDASDAALRFLAGGGVAASLFVIADVAAAPALAILWVFYLSLVTAGRIFLSYQWDALLLEAGFLALFFAPWEWLGAPWKRANQARPSSRPSLIMLWLLRWLLFRLMFLSGSVKLLSRDPTWRNLTALEYHYQTQPLPTPVAWYANQLPPWFQKASVAGVFGVELVVPFFIFAPRRLRLIAAALLACFQVLIAVTGNYAFFNLLTVTLCLPLLDDACFRSLIPRPWAASLANASEPSRARRALAAVLAVSLLLLSGTELTEEFSRGRAVPGIMRQVLGWVAPLQVVNTYGLFAVMTTSRPEIIVEGSNDGVTWLPYEFKYKPGDVHRRPPWVAPYQPRLDWQMWFAALESYRENPWFVNFMARLLEGSPEVLRLLAHNPFPSAPPHYIRALVYDYRFTTFAERRTSGDWWKRELRGSYIPVISLEARWPHRLEQGHTERQGRLESTRSLSQAVTAQNMIFKLN